MKTKVEIQIDDNPPFIPDEFERSGRLVGLTETTNPEDTVRNYKPTSMVYSLDYVLANRRIKNYYRCGKWETGTNGIPRCHVWELLDWSIKK